MKVEDYKLKKRGFWCEKSFILVIPTFGLFLFNVIEVIHYPELLQKNTYFAKIILLVTFILFLMAFIANIKQNRLYNRLIKEGKIILAKIDWRHSSCVGDTAKVRCTYVEQETGRLWEFREEHHEECIGAKCKARFYQEETIGVLVDKDDYNKHFVLFAYTLNSFKTGIHKPLF